MTDTQKHLLKLFKEIIEICHANDIEYYMAGGTLIGVLRHKGFIPWDDDLDIMMTRKHWDRFVEICKDSLPDNRVLECQELNRSYPNTIGRYTDLDSAAIHVNDVLGDGHAGYVIDILVLDPIPDLKAHRKYTEDFMLYSDIINPTINYGYRLMMNHERYKKAMKRVEAGEREAVLTELEQAMFCYDEDECDYLVLRWGGVTFLFPKDMYGNSRWGEFEGLKCRIPDKSSDYLVQHFGDEWTTIPPHDEQAAHDAIFSETVHYDTIQKDYLPFIDIEDTRKKLVQRKLFYYDQMKFRYELERNMAVAKADICRMEVLKRIEDSDIDMETALKEMRYQDLLTLFAPYIAMQSDRMMIGREDFGGVRRYDDPIFIDIGDENLFYCLSAMVETNQISRAYRYLEVREKIKGQLSEILMIVRNFIRDFRAVITKYDIGDRAESLKDAEDLFEKHPRNLSLTMFLARAYIEFRQYDKAYELLQDAISRYPEEGYFLKYLGDYYMQHDNNETLAVEYYQKARETTDNGMALLEIDEILGPVPEEESLNDEN